MYLIRSLFLIFSYSLLDNNSLEYKKLSIDNCRLYFTTVCSKIFPPDNVILYHFLRGYDWLNHSWAFHPLSFYAGSLNVQKYHYNYLSSWQIGDQPIFCLIVIAHIVAYQTTCSTNKKVPPQFIQLSMV